MPLARALQGGQKNRVLTPRHTLMTARSRLTALALLPPSILHGHSISTLARKVGSARRLKPNCLIMPQNGEELLLRKNHVDLIDAIAKEDPL